MATARWYLPGGNVRPLVSGSPWDVLTIDGTVLGGRAKITGAKAAWQVDEKKAAGKDAARPTKHRYDASEVGIEIEVINVDEMDAVNQALAPYVPKPGGAFDPVTISHAQIDHLPGVKSITVREVSEWRRDGARMTLTVRGRVWVATEKPPARGKSSKVETPTKRPVNKRREDAQRRGTIGGANPAPSSQAGFCGPSFSPGN